MLKASTKFKVISLLALAIMLSTLAFIAIQYLNKNKINKYVDIKNLVSETYTTPDGYSENLKKHVSENVFKSSNAYLYYNDLKSGKVETPHMAINEINQHKINNSIFVYMNYSFTIDDSKGSILHCAMNVPVVFEVINNKDGIYIKNKHEYESPKDVPSQYK